MALNPFNRYRPPSSTAVIAPPPLPGAYTAGSAGFGDSQDDEDGDTPDYRPLGDDNFDGRQATGPAAQLQQMPAPQSSPADKLEGAAKLPPPMAGGPIAASAPAPMPAIAPAAPKAPPAMNGGPRSIDTIMADYSAVKDPELPKPNIWRKLAAAGIGGAAGFSNVNPRNRQIDPTLAEETALYGPGYLTARQQAAEKRARLGNELGLAEKAESIKTLAQTRKENADTHLQTVMDSMNQHGNMFLLNEEPVPVGPDGKPSLVKIPHPMGNDPRFAGYSVYHDPHFGQVFVTPEISKQANIPSGWLDRKAYEDVVKNISQRQKPDTVPVSSATAKAMGIEAQPDQNGLVHVPTNAHTAWLTQQNKPETKTADERNYERSKAEGFKGSFEDWLTRDANRKTPRPVTSVNFTSPGADGSGGDPLIKSIANYEVGIPTPRTSSPAAMETYRKMVAAVKSANPQWDAKTFPVAQKTLNDFSNGREATSVNAINTAAGHIGQLAEAARALDGGDITALNRIANAWGLQTGNDRLSVYKTIVNRLAPEITKAYVGAGGGEGDRAAAASDFDPALGTKRILANLGVSAKLFNSKINALGHQFEKAVPGRKFDGYITPEAQAAFDQFGGGGATGGKHAMGGYEVGHVYGDGMTYLGGDPNDSANWKKK